jgi:hypothetical protein
MDVLGKPLLYLACESIGYFLLVMLVEKLRSSPEILAWMRPSTSDVVSPEEPPIDSDVAAEKERVQSGRADDDVILLKGLRKVFPGPNGGAKVAVKDQWFGIPSGEIFGFLGKKNSFRLKLRLMIFDRRERRREDDDVADFERGCDPYKGDGDAPRR